MKRKVECQSKVESVVIGRGSTPESGEIAPDVEKREWVLLFYDADELPSHRNAYQIVLTPDEAAKFEVDNVYTLTIG